jgi:alkylation response protein AidB-like acyl-CoA dehydrogenase
MLGGWWPLDGFEQRELRRLSKIAKRNCVGIADVVYEAVESFVAKSEAVADLEDKLIDFPTVAKACSAMDRRIPQMRAAFIRSQNETLLVVAGVRIRSFAAAAADIQAPKLNTIAFRSTLKSPSIRQKRCRLLSDSFAPLSRL